jgi:hypothetical protein
MVLHTGIIVVKKKQVSFEKVKLSDADIKYKDKLKDKGDKYYTKYKVKDKDGKDKNRTMISIKLTYIGYDGNPKEKEDVRIITGLTFDSEAQIDAFLEDQIRIIERNIRDQEATRMRDECEDALSDKGCQHIVISEDYDVVI